MLSSGSNIQLQQRRRHSGIFASGDKHHIRITRKHINQSSVVGIADFHSLELTLGLGTAQFELFYNVGDTLESMAVVPCVTV